MKKLLEWVGILRKPEPVPEPPKKHWRPFRISVALPDGTVVVHYGGSRTINEIGQLTIHAGPVGRDTGVVATYAAGAWLSCSVGKRAIQNRNTRRITARKPASKPAKGAK